MGPTSEDKFFGCHGSMHYLALCWNLCDKKPQCNVKPYIYYQRQKKYDRDSSHITCNWSSRKLLSEFLLLLPFSILPEQILFHQVVEYLPAVKPYPFKQFFGARNFPGTLFGCFVWKTLRSKAKQLRIALGKFLVPKNCLNGWSSKLREGSRWLNTCIKGDN